MRILLTGAAGFLGMHTCERLLARGDEVVGVDNLNDYYAVSLKEARLARLKKYAGFSFQWIDIANREGMSSLFERTRPQRVVHLAAQPGVRHSLSHPHAYVDANLQGFMNVLEGSRHFAVEHLVYASSSSVYGGNGALPFSEHQGVDHPISLYAATKKANELMAHAYSHLFRVPTTGLRFFTAYGPWGRPDMAPFLFIDAILKGRPIDIFNGGMMVRDFTYVDDIVEGVVRVIDKPAFPNPAFDPAQPDPATSVAPYRIFNIGNNHPTQLMEFIAALEHATGKKAEKRFLPMQPGDVPNTAADTSELEAWIAFKPSVSVQVGVESFVEWYRSYFRI